MICLHVIVPIQTCHVRPWQRATRNGWIALWKWTYITHPAFDYGPIQAPAFDTSQPPYQPSPVFYQYSLCLRHHPLQPQSRTTLTSRLRTP